jgi:ferric-dicitrate binding protein FerR (iron transport regulator)
VTERRTRADAEHALSRLAATAERALTGAPTPEDDVVLARVEGAWASRGSRRRRRRLGLAFGLAAASATAAWVGVRRHVPAETALTFVVTGAPLAAGGYVSTTPEAAAQIAFSDGSSVGLRPRSRARVAEVDARGGRVLLEEGKARVQVTPRPKARWSVEAGPYTVRVTGTVFDVAWSGGTEVFEVRMAKGSVVVTGPLATHGIRLDAGQHLSANTRDGKIALDGVETAAGPDAEGPVLAPAGGGEPEPTVTAPKRKAATRRSTAAPIETGESGPWARLLAKGAFRDVVRAAEGEGISEVLARAPRGELSALANAARYQRRTELARQALFAERGRFPGSREAREAAFYLGGLSEEDSDPSGLADALSWYDVYLGEERRGVYAMQALGRKMTVVQRLRGPAAARPIALGYLEQYPDGPYAELARTIALAK